MFSAEDDDEEEKASKKRKLKKIVYTDEQLRAAGIDPELERKKLEKVYTNCICPPSISFLMLLTQWC